MHEHRTQDGSDENAPPNPRRRPEFIERAILFELLRDDHDERWSPAELSAAISKGDEQAIRDALTGLEHHGVVVAHGEESLASRCAQHIDTLGVIGI